ncbi:MAG: phosphopantetheine-binding protein [Candidatus Methylomirabilales bacterium]
MASIAEWELDLPEVAPHTSLIRSGLFDSVALLNLVLWVEERIGGPVDPSGFDLMREWDTVADIVAFVQTRRRREAA